MCWKGTIEPGLGRDPVVDLNGVPDGYQAMNDHTGLKVMVNP